MALKILVAAMCCCGIVLLVVFGSIAAARKAEEVEWMYEQCDVVEMSEEQYDCYRQSSCSCSSSCHSAPCSTLRANVGQEGSCCEGSCCMRTCCDGCYRSQQVCDPDGCHDESYYDDCCEEYCCEHGTDQCRVDWDYCWRFHTSFRRLKDRMRYYSSSERECGFADYDCRREHVSTLTPRALVDCWVLPETNETTLLPPNDKSPYIWPLLGVGTGLLCSACCILVYALVEG
eukprot:Sspe_Gene.79804::Locus_50141_Transcript_2_2_Confidence_0.600_Length_797::g.79804::m.79804